ncbi:MAG: alpha/beta fold hydrolase [Chloroflexota bacterium]
MQLFADPIHQPFEFGERSSAVGALLLHGFSGTPAEMRHAGQAIANTGIFVKGMLLPGFGSDIENLKHQTDETWLNACRKVWLEFSQQFDCTILVGFSMGGALATVLATETAPDHLILMAPFIRFESRLADIALPALQYVKPTISPFEFGDISDPDFRDSLLEMIPDLDLDNSDTINRLKEEMVLPTKVLVCLRRLGRMAKAHGKRVSTKVTILQGKDDTVVLPELTQAFSQRFRAASQLDLHMLPNATHAFPKSAGAYQEVLTKAVADWLPEKV